MNRLQREVKEKFPSKSKFAREADLATSTVCECLNGHSHPYPGQLRKMAAALGWQGDPDELLEEVPDDER